MDLRELLKEIILSNNLEIEDKLDIIEKLMFSGSILPNFYIAKLIDNKIECWYRYENEEGKVERKKTGWDDPKQIINEYIKNKEITKIR